MSSPKSSGFSVEAAQQRLLVALTVIAIVLGTVARFKGLGKWPFGVDEYYFARSVENLLRFGVPAFECGGYYFRGVLLQYLAAGLQLLGLSPELAPRTISAVSSLLALPAAFLIGRRINGTATGLLLVILLAISVWQIEMARFGRFYAPFQAVFLWYLVFFLRYTVDRQASYLWGMVSLTIVGVLVSETGVLLAVANLLPPFINHDRGRLKLKDLGYLAGMGALLWPVHWFATADFRRVPGALPPDFDQLIAAARPEFVLQSAPLIGTIPLISTILDKPVWLIAGLVPLGLSIWALGWIASYRDRWLAAAGLLVALVAVLLHHVLVAVSVLGLLLLLRMLDWRELFDRRALPYLSAVASIILLWCLFALLNPGGHGATNDSVIKVLEGLGYQLLGYPNVLDMIARPWGQAVPLLGLSLMATFLISAAWLVARGPAAADAERTLVIVTAVMVLLVGIADAPRIESRYSFFLYPAFLVIALCVLFRALAPVAARLGAPSLIVAALVFGWFALTEDFKPRHLAKIDSAEVNFRIGMKPRVASHYYVRSDIRGVSDWLTENTNSPDDLVINGPGIASLDAYYPGLDFVYVDPSDQRLGAWACLGGTVDRWSNLPLVYSIDELIARISSSPRSFLVIDSRLAEEFLPRFGQPAPTVAWENPLGTHSILLFESPGTHEP